MRTLMRKYIQTIESNIEIREQYNEIIKKRRTYLRNRNNNSGNSDLKYGYRDLIRASTNVANMKTDGAINTITKHLRERNVDIDRIQEKQR